MTLDADKLQTIRTIVTHENCSDGLASAMILKSVLPGANVVFLSYNSAAHKELSAIPGMIFCDFSPYVERVQEFIDAGAIVLDHHKYQKDVVEAFGANGVFADETTNPGVAGALLAYQEVWLPLVKSDPQSYLNGGARLAFEQYQLQLSQLKASVSDQLLKSLGEKPSVQSIDQNPEVVQLNQFIENLVTKGTFSNTVERFARLISTRDTWQTQSELWHAAREAHEALQFFSKDTWLKTPIFPNNGEEVEWNIRMSMGHFLVEKQDRKTAKVLEGAYKGTTPNGLKVLIHQGVSATSDVAEMSTGNVDLILGFSYFSEKDDDLVNWPGAGNAVGPKIAVSCRTRNGFDVGAFAKAHGGGGHTKAAGFSFNVKPEDPNPYIYLLNLVKAYTP